MDIKELSKNISNIEGLLELGGIDGGLKDIIKELKSLTANKDLEGLKSLHKKTLDYANEINDKK